LKFWQVEFELLKSDSRTALWPTTLQKNTPWQIKFVMCMPFYYMVVVVVLPDPS